MQDHWRSERTVPWFLRSRRSLRQRWTCRLLDMPRHNAARWQRTIAGNFSHRPIRRNKSVTAPPSRAFRRAHTHGHRPTQRRHPLQRADRFLRQRPQAPPRHRCRQALRHGGRGAQGARGTRLPLCAALVGGASGGTLFRLHQLRQARHPDHQGQGRQALRQAGARIRRPPPRRRAAQHHLLRQARPLLHHRLRACGNPAAAPGPGDSRNPSNRQIPSKTHP